MIRKCFKCEKELKALFDDMPDDIHNSSDDAVHFTSWGNYGSTRFDPIREWETLDIYVCDECLIKHSNIINHVLTYKTTKHEFDIRSFKEYREEELKRIDDRKNANVDEIIKDHPIMGPVMEQRNKDE
jgi:hypothetical protein